MKKICIISADPNFWGGVSLYTWNVINSLKRLTDYELLWIYRGDKTRIYKKNQVTFVELGSSGQYPLNEILFNFKVKKFLEKNHFDVINSHAIWGFWMAFYKRKNKQEIIHTYHGSTYHFFKSHFKRQDLFKKLESYLSMILGFVMEKPPWKRADKIICVSEHVKRELTGLYGGRKNISIISASIDLKKFKLRNKNISKKKVNLNKNRWYGLYVGRGGFWTKGLDRVVKISEEIYKKDENYRLLIVGADKDKVKYLINRKFAISLPPQSRDVLPYYYNSSDIFFNLSRYEGGNPTFSTGEAMASGCLVVCSKSSEQEIIENGENGLILENFDEKDAKKIIDLLKNKRKRERIIKNSTKTIKNFLLKNRGENTLVH